MNTNVAVSHRPPDFDAPFYAIVWFEGSQAYTLVDDSDKTVLISPAEAATDDIAILRDEDDVDRAEEDVRYAISPALLEDLFGEQQ